MLADNEDPPVGITDIPSTVNGSLDLTADVTTKLLPSTGPPSSVGVEEALPEGKRTPAKGHHEEPNLKEDAGPICLLLFLYVLQRVPIGLTAALPLILQSRNVTYAQQAIFSLVYWPYSLKLLWAPIVDAVFLKRLGRRKSWTVGCQYVTGAFLLIMSFFAEGILGLENGPTSKPPNVVLLTAIMLPVTFLAATQDVAVDGWALTMLSRKNVGYAPTCDAVGGTIGVLLGNALFLALQSKELANKWIRSVPQDRGLVRFDEFVFFWGCIILAATTLLLLFKKEVDRSEEEHVHEVVDENGNKLVVAGRELTLNVTDTYTMLLKILRLKPVIQLCAILLTSKIAFAGTVAMTNLKFIDAGVTADKFASLHVIGMPVHIVLPWLLGKHTAGPRPLNLFLVAYVLKTVLAVLLAALVYWTPYFLEENGEFSYGFYALLISKSVTNAVLVDCFSLSMVAFFAQISDPKIGGTYMTLLNTLFNLGGKWPSTLVLSVADLLSFKNCISGETNEILGSCSAKSEKLACVAAGNTCHTIVDGYYVSVGLCIFVGVVWYAIFFRRVKRIQKVERSEWRVARTN